MKQMMILLPAAVQTALERLAANGYEGYIVGGCVRDSLLGCAPNDWDITTNALPQQTAQCFFDCRIIETGIQHGTVTVLMGDCPLEITTYRNDGEYLDNRHPVKVTFSSELREDLCRRDFTVNAMAYHPTYGLVDLFGGVADLADGIIRCVGEAGQRFDEDGLRILRAIRFASTLNFQIEQETADAIHSRTALLHGIASERIREEFYKLLCGKGAPHILRQYADVIGVVIPELLRCVGFVQNSRYHCYDVYEHTLNALEYCNADGITRLALLFHDVGKPFCYTEDADGGHFKGHAQIGAELCSNVLRRLRFDNDTIQRVQKLVELHDLPILAQAKSVKRLMQKLSDDDILRLLEIKRCDRLAHAEKFRDIPEELGLIPAIIKQIREEEGCFSLKNLKLNGDDLLLLGVKEGKQIGFILNALLEDVIEERLSNEREALLSAAKLWIGREGQ